MDPMTLQSGPDWPVLLMAIGMLLAYRVRDWMAMMADFTGRSAFRYRTRR